MKIFAIFRRWWLIVLTVILLIIGDTCYIRFVKNSMTRACGGRTISAGVIRSNMTMFVIAVNDKPVYMEIDENNNGKTNSIVHCEKGVAKYATQIHETYTNHQFIYYGEMGDKYILSDVGEIGVFTQRVWESPGGKMVAEGLVEGHWIPISGQGSNGISRPATPSINMRTITEVVQ